MFQHKLGLDINNDMIDRSHRTGKSVQRNFKIDEFKDRLYVNAFEDI